MQFFIIMIILLIISLLLAYRSLRHVMHMKELGSVKKELHRGKILFKKD